MTDNEMREYLEALGYDLTDDDGAFSTAILVDIAANVEKYKWDSTNEIWVRPNEMQTTKRSNSQKNTIFYYGQSIEALDDGTIELNGSRIRSYEELETSMNLLIKSLISVVSGSQEQPQDTNHKGGQANEI